MSLPGMDLVLTLRGQSLAYAEYPQDSHRAFANKISSNARYMGKYRRVHPEERALRLLWHFGGFCSLQGAESAIGIAPDVKHWNIEC
jgi:hypothetical protein